MKCGKLPFSRFRTSLRLRTDEVKRRTRKATALLTVNGSNETGEFKL